MRVTDADPAYVRAGRIRRACGCRELRITHAPAGMDSSVRYCINRLGLRGTLPDDTAVRIITLGNSTTECAYIDDAATWPHLLACGLAADGHDAWVGNAGVNGTSTQGNTIFLEDHLLDLHPDIVLFMPGAADRGRISAKQDAGLMAPDRISASQWFMEHSRLIGSMARLVQARVPRTIDWSTFAGAPASADTSRMRGSRVPLADHDVLVAEYAERIARIADLNILRPEFARELTQAFQYLTALRLDAQLSAEDGKGALMRPSELSNMERDLLRDAFAVVKQFREIIRRHFNLQMFG